MARAFGVSPDQLHDPAPSPFHNTQLVNIKAEPAHTRASDAAYADWRRQWLDVNTALYWHIEHSLDLSGPERVRDESKLDSYVAQSDPPLRTNLQALMNPELHE